MSLMFFNRKNSARVNDAENLLSTKYWNKLKKSKITMQALFFIAIKFLP